MSRLFTEKYNNEILGISGFTRSGKAMLMKLISTFKNVEKSHTDILLEQIYILHRIKKINFESASYLLRKNIVIFQFYNSIGRNVNYKKNDFSSVYNYHNPSLYLKRSETLNIKLNFIPKKYLVQIMLHSGLNSAELIMKSLETLKIIEIFKNPLELVFSWIKKDYGKKYIYKKPNVYKPTIKYKNEILPFYANGWESKFLKMSHFDRCANMIFYLIDERSKQISKLSPKQKKNILLISFDKLVKNPKKELIKISKFIKKKPSKITFQQFKKEKIPRKLFDKDYDNKVSFLKKNLSKKYFTKLLKYESEYLKKFKQKK